LYHQSAASPNIICAKLEQKYEKQEKACGTPDFIML